MRRKGGEGGREGGRKGGREGGREGRQRDDYIHREKHSLFKGKVSIKDEANQLSLVLILNLLNFKKRLEQSYKQKKQNNNNKCKLSWY